MHAASSWLHEGSCLQAAADTAAEAGGSVLVLANSDVDLSNKRVHSFFAPLEAESGPVCRLQQEGSAADTPAVASALFGALQQQNGVLADHPHAQQYATLQVGLVLQRSSEACDQAGAAAPTWRTLV